MVSEAFFVPDAVAHDDDEAPMDTHAEGFWAREGEAVMDKHLEHGGKVLHVLVGGIRENDNVIDVCCRIYTFRRIHSNPQSRGKTPIPQNFRPVGWTTRSHARNEAI